MSLNRVSAHILLPPTASPGQLLSGLLPFSWCPGPPGLPSPTLVSMPPLAPGGDLSRGGKLGVSHRRSVATRDSGGA